MVIRSFILTIILMVNLNGYTQTDIKSVRKEVALFNFSRAVEMLHQELLKNAGKPSCEATLLLADCYRMLNDVENAKIWYAKAIEMEGTCHYAETLGPVIFDYYAQALRSSGEYLLAKKFFMRYDSLVQGQHRGAFFSTYCDSAIAWQKAIPEFEIRNVKTLNTPQSEFGTVFYQQGIIFASDRISAGNGNNTYGWTGNNYLNLYYSKPVKTDSIFGDYLLPLPALNLPDHLWHVGPVSFNHDFTEIFLNQTKLNHDRGKADPGKIRTHLLKLFSSGLHDDTWSAPQPFFLNSDEYSVGHPALSSDGKTLYFVSDMPGGYGETDIWVCRKEDNSWSKPVNLGPVVNSAGKEMFTFIAANGDLYFASDGLPGFGGLDLYVTKQEKNQWSAPHNLGFPLNSSYDDFSLCISENNDVGLFSSNRPGGAGSDDIYCFRKIRKSEQKPTDSIPKPSLAIQPPPVIPSMDTLKINKSYRLENIFYNFDKWDIRADAKPSLDKLVGIMKEYPISIELGSHTDCRGSEAYNLELSQKRAESAVQYIISQGISITRIVAKGYGKSQLINQCNCAEGVACTEKEHQENRRTEFRITSIIGK